MKQLSLWAKANMTPLFGLLITIAVLTTWTSETWGYENYSGGCDNCHGGFTDSPYTSPSDGSNWGDSLHNIHRNDMVASDCDVCHTGSSFGTVLLESSNGGAGLAAIGCVGCHGRDEDAGNTTTTGTSQRGAGLRQHHVGFASCSGCHDDQTGYTPVGENILPNYYANPGTGHPAMPTDPCNPSGSENFAGTALGLDNDGDATYDTADSDCTTAAPTYTVGGNVSGLTGTGLQLQNNGADPLAVAADGPFTFAMELSDGSAYAVTVSSQPAGQTCSVSNGSGTIATANVTNVAVTCVDDVVPTYSVGGNVSGLTGTGLQLQNNGADPLAVAADGPFTFAIELTDGSAYAVTVSSQPAGQTCSVSNGSGTIATADVTNVAVTCVTDVVPTYSVGGNVSGLTGTGLQLQNNGADSLAVAADGPFTFATALSDGSAYAVTVSSQPAGQTCSVSNGSGTIATANVTNVAVTCVTDVVPTYSVGGNVSGLTGNGLQLQNNGADSLAVAADGPFTFATALSDGSAYAVTVSSQPTDQTCSVSNGSGTITMANVTNVAVTCVDEVVTTYSVGGNVSGLTGTGLQLQNNGADSLAVAADGPFTFATELTDGSAYAVTVSSQPTDQTCSVSNGSGTITMANVTNVAVTCVDEVVTTYSVGGNVSGLTGTGLQLQNNGADPLAVAADGPFTFAIELTDGSAYAVTVSSQPTGQSCTVSNGSGTIATADVTNVAVTCVADVVTTHSVGGNVSGLTGPRLIMRNNGKDRLVVDADGPFTFATELSDGSVYAVTVSSQPTGQNCTVSNGSGTIATADVTNVAVTCVDGVPIPPPNSNTSIPTLSTWALVVLSMLLGLMAFLNRRRLF